MPTKTYAQLLTLIQSLCGITFAPIELGRINAFINRRAFIAYRATNFGPRFLQVGKELPMYNASTSQTTIVSGDTYVIKTNPSNEFIALGASSEAVGTIFTATSSTTLSSGSVSPYLGYISYDQPTYPDVDTFIRLFNRKPYQTNSVQEYDYHISPDGAVPIIGSTTPASAFVVYKATNSAQYGTDIGAGETTEIPLEWFQYLGHAVYADYLRSEGQQEKSQLADAEAQMLLDEELIRIDNQRSTGMLGTRISTNSNFQFR
jgi:hypothetical protein